MIGIASRSFHLLSRGGFLVTLLFSLQGRAYFGTGGEITGFNLISCGTKNCLSIESGRAFTGMIPFSFAFASATISIIDKETKATTKIQAEDIFFDSVAHRIFIRKMAERQNAEAIYDLQTEKLSVYPVEHFIFK